MFKIGEFSKLAMVTVKSLRFHDEEGLLKPVFVDKRTNYRYYATEQLYDLHKIISFRQAGLSISEIKAVTSGSNAQEILGKRKSELEKECEEAADRLLRITKIIENMKEGYKMQFQATIKDIPGYDVFYGVKKLRAFSDLNEFICSLGEECAANNPGIKCAYPEYCYVTYLDEEFVTENFTAMYAQAVEKIGQNSKNVKFTTLPAVKAVSVLVKGNYNENLPAGFAFAIEWVEENGWEIADKIRQIYIDGVWNRENPDDYLTEIQIPVRKL